KVQKAQADLRQLYEEGRGYAAPLRLEREQVDLRAVWRQAWDSLAPARQGRDAALVEEDGGPEPRCPGDPFRLEQVFRNVLDNALAAARRPARLPGPRLADAPAPPTLAGARDGPRPT